MILSTYPKAQSLRPIVDEGFLLDYSTNEYEYHVFNKTTSCVEIEIDVIFDEFDGSKKIKSMKRLRNEKPPHRAIKRLAIGEVRSREAQNQNKDEDPQVQILYDSVFHNG